VSGLRERDPRPGSIRDRGREADGESAEPGPSFPGWLRRIFFVPAPPRAMAHRDPHVAGMSRHMAHQSARPRLDLPGILEPIRSRFSRWSASGEPRRREAVAVLILVVVASMLSVIGPTAGARATTEAPISADSYVDPTAIPPDELGPDVTDSPTEEFTPWPTEEPTAAPAATKQPGATRKPTPKPVVVHTFVALGDSLTAWPAGNPWPSRLDAIDPALKLIKNTGIPGNTTAQMRARFAADVLPYKPSVLFVLGGTNDLGLGISQSAIISNLRAIVVAAKAKKIQPILLLVPPDSWTSMAPKINSLNAAIVNLANSQRVVYVDIHAPLANSAGVYYGKYTVDGLHFTSLGAQVVANTIRARLKGRGL
jgi:lysophospholipase L1-like esterase